MIFFGSGRSLMHGIMLLLVDLLLIILSTALALLLRNNFEVSSGQIMALVPYTGITIGAAVPVLAVLGLHRSVWRFSTLSDYLRVLVSAIVITASAVVIGFVANRLDGVARALPVLQCLLMTFSLVGVRVGMRVRYAARRRPVVPVLPISGEHRQQNVLVLGLNSIAELYLRTIEEFGGERVKVAGLIGRGDHHVGRLVQQYPILGVPEGIMSVIDSLSVHGVVIDRIIVAMPFDALSAEAREELLNLEKTCSISLDFLHERILDPQLNDAIRLNRAAIRVDAAADQAKAIFKLSESDVVANMSGLFWVYKRAFDITASAILIVLLAPVFVLLTLCVAADIGLPVLFWQQRPGRAGRPFRLYKFRTMAGAHNARGQRIPDSERVSTLGRFMRRTRLDELPQLFNILIGDMSMVGPRPLLPIDQSSEASARLLVRPGLTGWAQVRGGRIVEASDKAALDVWYVCHASIWLDFEIMARTVPMVLWGERPNFHAIQSAWHDLRQAGVCSENV